MLDKLPTSPLCTRIARAASMELLNKLMMVATIHTPNKPSMAICHKLIEIHSKISKSTIHATVMATAHCGIIRETKRPNGNKETTEAINQ